MIPDISNSSGLYIRESTPRIVLSCLPVVGIAMLIYNLYLNRVQINSLNKKVQKLRDDMERTLEDQVRTLEHRSNSLEQSLHHQIQSIQTNERMISYLQEQEKYLMEAEASLNNNNSQANIDQTNEFIDRKMKESAEIYSQFEQGREQNTQHEVALNQNSEITSKKSEELDDKIRSIQLQQENLGKRARQINNQTGRYLKYFLFSNIVYLALAITGVALGILGTMGPKLITQSALLCGGTLILGAGTLILQKHPQ